MTKLFLPLTKCTVGHEFKTRNGDIAVIRDKNIGIDSVTMVTVSNSSVFYVFKDTGCHFVASVGPSRFDLVQGWDATNHYWVPIDADVGLITGITCTPTPTLTRSLFPLDAHPIGTEFVTYMGSKAILKDVTPGSLCGFTIINGLALNQYVYINPNDGKSPTHAIGIIGFWPPNNLHFKLEEELVDDHLSAIQQSDAPAEKKFGRCQCIVPQPIDIGTKKTWCKICDGDL